MPGGHTPFSRPGRWSGRDLRGPMILALVCTAVTTSAAGPIISGCPVFPEDHILNTPVDTLPVHSNSAEWIATIGAGGHLHPDFGAPPEYGIPYMVVSSNEPGLNVIFDYADESDHGPYPAPTNAPVEGGALSTGDRHVLVLEKDNGKLYEMWDAHPQTNSWRAGSGAIFDLRGYGLRPHTWTSADAAGLPILPLLVRYDEIAAGEIRHALRFTTVTTQESYLWPARHEAGSSTLSSFPPMGARLRLKASFDLAGFDPTNRVILRALQKYGMILADNGSPWYISGASDPRFDDDSLHDLSAVTGAVFEVVDCSYLMTNSESGGARSPYPVFHHAGCGDTSFAFSVELLPNLSHTVERCPSLVPSSTWDRVEQFTPTTNGDTVRVYPLDVTNACFYRVRR